jgi:molybdopterin converting factor small subunit
VESQFTGSSKAYTSSLIKILISEKYTGGDVRDHILRMSNIATRLKPLDLAIKDGVLIYLIFNSFSKEFETFEVNYNFKNDKCTLKKFIAMCVQEEERIKHNNSGVFRNLLSIMRKSNNSFLYRMYHVMNLLKDLRRPKGQLSLKITRFRLAKKF